MGFNEKDVIAEDYEPQFTNKSVKQQTNNLSARILPEKRKINKLKHYDELINDITNDIIPLDACSPGPPRKKRRVHFMVITNIINYLSE